MLLNFFSCSLVPMEAPHHLCMGGTVHAGVLDPVRGVVTLAAELCPVGAAKMDACERNGQTLAVAAGD